MELYFDKKVTVSQGRQPIDGHLYYLRKDGSQAKGKLSRKTA